MVIKEIAKFFKPKETPIKEILKRKTEFLNLVKDFIDDLRNGNSDVHTGHERLTVSYNGR